MNMHEQFITLETAKLAKQAGFDWEVNHRYAILCKGTVAEKITFREVSEFPPQNFNRFIDTFSAPTQAVLQRWLREEKDMLIIINFPKGEQWFQSLITSYSKPNAETAKDVGWYKTIEAALEAGLQKCLTLLIEKQC